MLDFQPPALPFSPPQSSTGEPHPNEICRLVAACVALDFGLDAAALETGLRGSQRMAFARQIAMYLAHIGFGLSFEIIGHASWKMAATTSGSIAVSRHSN